MTKKEIEEKIAYLREIFDVVRVVDPSTMQDLSDTNRTFCQCFEFWKKDCACVNCISKEVVATKCQKTKLECVDGDLYQVISRYIEVEGHPYALEMVQCLDADTFLREDGDEEVIEKLTGYSEKLYEDVLTGAYNRRYYEDKLKSMDQTAGVAIIDVDDFKVYNDAYGHSAGDMALATTSHVIKSCIRQGDVLVRYGGDEFLLVLPGVDETGLKAILQRICEEIRRSSVPGYVKMQLSVSVGGVVSNGISMEEAVEKADKMMYLAKNHKNMVVTEHDTQMEDWENGEIVDREKMKQLILIIDDSQINRELLSEMLQDEYRIIEAQDGQEGLRQIRKYGTEISLILLDIVMPKLDGFGVLEEMNRKHWMEDIPVIMISNEDSEAVIRRSYELGVSDYISRPFDAKVVYRRVLNTIKLYAKQRRLVSLVTEHMNEKEKNNRMMIDILSEIVEFRNGESGMHVHHINRITKMLIDKLAQKTDKYKILWEERARIITASSLHDIGKIGIDEKILNKPGKLTKEEFQIMKQHSEIGARMLESLEQYQDERLVQTAIQICRSHHERYDGRGYPDGLVGDEIPIAAQIVSVADVYDALTSERVYKHAFSHEISMEMIVNGECGAFNPILIECLVEIQDQLKAMKQK